jgi:hypothetical protein
MNDESQFATIGPKISKISGSFCFQNNLFAFCLASPALRTSALAMVQI